jgi:hypothetical protein
LRAISPAADHLEGDVLVRLAGTLFGALPQDEAHARSVVTVTDLGVDVEVRRDDDA